MERDEITEATPPATPDDVDLLLDGLRERPLAEQVAVFEEIHAVLTERLSEPDA